MTVHTYIGGVHREFKNAKSACITRDIGFCAFDVVDADGVLHSRYIIDDDFANIETDKDTTMLWDNRRTTTNGIEVSVDRHYITCSNTEQAFNFKTINHMVLF